MFLNVEALVAAAAANRTSVAQRADRVGPQLAEVTSRSRAGGSVATLLGRTPMLVAGVRSAARRTVGLGLRLRPSLVR